MSCIQDVTDSHYVLSNAGFEKEWNFFRCWVIPDGLKNWCLMLCCPIPVLLFGTFCSSLLLSVISVRDHERRYIHVVIKPDNCFC